jgi:hypothetical protein
MPQLDTTHTEENDTYRTTIPQQHLPSKRDSLPLGLRNKKMKATDCLLFAATLLEKAGDNHSINDIQTNDCIALDVSESQQQYHSSTNTSASAYHQQTPTQSTPQVCTMSAVVDGTKLMKSSNSRPVKVSSSSQDTTAGTTGEVIEPKDLDVLCGRGGKVNQHPGNMVYRKVVEYNKPFYQSVHKRNRMLVSQSIVQSILNYGGRFLTSTSKDKSWTTIEFKKAVQKTSQALREFKKTSSDGTETKGEVDEKD